MWKTEPRQPSAISPREKSIKQNARLSVKHALWFVAFLALWTFQPVNTPAWPDEPPPAPDSGEPLPDIEARMRQLKVISSSSSQRVYLLEFAAAAPPAEAPVAESPAPGGVEKPAENKILLLRNGQENVMALRILRDINGTNQVIAKRIKQYGDHNALDVGLEFHAVEKVSDLIPPPPTPQDKADMAEVEPAPLPFDPDLDTGSSPTPDSHAKDAEGDERLGASIEEKIVPFEAQRHWLAVAFGGLRNTPDGSKAQYYMGGGVRYGYDVARRLFVSRDERLDTFTLEGSVFYYSVSGLDAGSTDPTVVTTTGTDTYNIAPLSLTGRYTYYFNEDFGWFLYGGVMKNMVLSSSNSTATRVQNLSLASPAFGIGALLRIGPQWYTRIDAGLDMIATNLMIRF